MEQMQIELHFRWSIMTLLTKVWEYDHWIKQAWGIITPAVLSITNMPQEHIQPTERIKTAVSHSNCSSYSSFYIGAMIRSSVLEMLFDSVFTNKTCTSNRLCFTMMATARCCCATTPRHHWAVAAASPTCPSSERLFLPTPLDVCFHTCASATCNSRTRLDRNVPECALQLAPLLVCWNVSAPRACEGKGMHAFEKSKNRKNGNNYDKNMQTIFWQTVSLSHCSSGVEVWSRRSCKQMHFSPTVN